MTGNQDMDRLAGSVLAAARDRGLKIATAESCTGGLIAAALTEIPGSSDVFERGFVTYSNEAKCEMIGVPSEVIAEHGAVSGEVAGAMAEGAVRYSRAHLAVAVTGVAGPDGRSPEKPIGLVWFGLAGSGRETDASQRLFGDRNRREIRRLTVMEALKMLEKAVRQYDQSAVP
jgi:nicotinamide-nucleotide amidase